MAKNDQKKYQMITMMSWPLNRFAPALCGIPQIVIGGLLLVEEKIYENLGWVTIFGLGIIPWLVIRKDVKRGAKYLRKAEAKLFLSSANLSLRVIELEEFLENLEKQKKLLSDKKEVLARKISGLQDNQKNWKTLSKTEGVAHIVGGLSQEIKEAKSELETLENNIGILDQKKSEIKEKTAILARCKETMALGVKIYDASGGELIKKDSVAALAGASISSANSLMAECKNLLA